MSKAIFLDRDGVINRNTHYVNKWSDFEILPQVPDALKVLKEAGYKIFVVTNQGGIEKKFMTDEDVQTIHYGMKKALPEIDDIRYCPSYDSFDRKPNPGMIYDLSLEYEVYTRDSWIVGDSYTDTIAGYRAGCKTCLLMTNILEFNKYYKNKEVNITATDLMDATRRILQEDGLI